ncbi:TRAP transporter substrate-binding protein [Candidatus Babeliales bacterium]|nr:TRAP transporter substrate-binding protein [Candidatus Babeliales bacterium]
MKKLVLGFVICVFFVGLGLLFVDKAAGTVFSVDLKMSHFMPTKHTQHKVMATWAKKVGELSGGRIKVTIFPGGALGKPPQQYDSAVKGITDIAFGLQSYTPGRFPLTSCMRLPFMVKTGEQGSIVLWKLYEKYLKDEYKDVKLLWLLAHGAGQIYTTKKQVKTLEDFKGLKIRAPGPIMSKVIKRLGGVPVTMPITQVYTALERGTIDGLLGPWEVMRPFRLYETCKYASELDIYTGTFFEVMNKKRYESLPDDLRKVIDENSGMKMAIFAGRSYDKADAPAKELSLKKGITVYQLPAEEIERWKKAVKPVEAEWIKSMEAKGLPGKEVLDYAKELLRQTQ